MSTKPVLGKGLSSLISNNTKLSIRDGYNPALDVNLIETNPYQPRKGMDENKLDELANSIKTNGVLSPIIVTRKKGENEKYQLVAGERRLLASKIAGLKTIPAIIRELTDEKILLLALMENIQREDLTVLEESEALYQLHKKFKVTAAKLSRDLGLVERTVQQKIKLMDLPDEVKEKIRNGIINGKHGMLLGRIPSRDDMIEAMNIIIKRRLSATETQDFIKRFMIEHPALDRRRITNDAFNKITFMYERKFQDFIGSGFKVLLKRTYSGGSVVIKYKNDEELKFLEEKLAKLRDKEASKVEAKS